MARPMANDPPFATLNHSAADLGTPESQTSRGLVLELAMSTRYAVVNLAVITIGFCAAYWEQYPLAVIAGIVLLLFTTIKDPSW